MYFSDFSPPPPIGRMNIGFLLDATGTNASANIPMPYVRTNPQTGTSYEILTTDLKSLITFDNASPVAVTIAQATNNAALPNVTTNGDFDPGWRCDLLNLGAGDVTLTPVTSLVGGNATLVLKQYQFARIISDGTDFTVAMMSAINLAATGPGGVFGLLPIAHGGTGTSSPGLIAGSGVSITGSWPNQTVTTSSALTGGAVVKTGDYTALAADDGYLIVMNSASPHTITLPAAPPALKWKIAVANIGAGTLTVSPNGLNIDGSASSISVPQNQGFYVATDNSNYFTSRGMNTGGTVTSVGLTVPAFLSVAGSPVTTSGTLAVSLSGTALPVANGGTGTTTPALVAGSAIGITGTWPNNTIAAVTATASVLGVSKPDGTTITISGGVLSASGTVTSVALTLPAEFSVAGSPVTTSGTLAVTKATQSANQVWAGPTSGSAAAPAFRALVAADIPVQSYSTLTDGATVTWATAGAWVNNATLTMVHTTGSRTLNLTGITAGCTGTIIVKQDGTGGAALVLGTNSGAYTNKVVGGGSGAITVTSAANAVDILAWTYDGTSVFWNQGPNYT